MMLTMQVSGEIEEMNKRANVLKIQEVYRTSKWIPMRRYIDKEQSLQSQIDMVSVMDHFRRTWVRPEHELVEAEAGLIFHMEAVLMEMEKEEEEEEEEEEEMQSFMLDEKKIAEVIRSDHETILV
jgi:hypothetical protein